MFDHLPKETCTGCSACASVCPKNCIQMLPDGEGFLRPAVDENACISCGLCEKQCPVLHTPPAPQSESAAYAAAFQEEPVRMESTSGGVFTALSRWVFRKKGVVFGAAYDEDFSVFHCAAENEQELSRLRTAKYAQSRLDCTFQQVKDNLLRDRYVLFSGTPCQTAGLRAYLQKNFEKLILVDVICHGVPSPQIWQTYIRFRLQQDAPHSTLRSINLRSKETGWPNYSIRFEYEDGTVYSKKNNEDPFLRAFVGDLCLRPSCYDCRFKGISRNSDFTLADYWGIWSQLPEYDDGKGTSLVLVHSEKARHIWSELSDKLRFQAVEPAQSVRDNPSAVSSSPKPENRSAFMEHCAEEDFLSLVTELLPVPIPPPAPSLFKRGVRKINRILKQILS